MWDFADQLTVARAAAVPVVVVLFAWDFPDHDYWATAVFAVAMATDWFDGWWARRTGRTSDLGKLLDPIADKLLVVAALIMLVERRASRLDGRRDRRARAPRAPASGWPRSSAASSSAPATSAS